MQSQLLPYSGEDLNQEITNPASPFNKMAFLDARPEIQYLYGNRDATLLRVMQMLGIKSQAVKSQQVNWEEDTRIEISTTFSAAADAVTGQTTGSVTFTDGYRITNNCHVFVPATSEIMKVVSVNRATGVATVHRAINGGGAAIVAGYKAVVTPAYMAERSDVELSVGKTPVLPMSNYVSTFAESVSITKRAKGLDRGVLSIAGDVDKWSWAKMELEWDVRKKIQFAMLFEGRRAVNTSGGQQYIAGGLAQFISANIYDFGQVAGNTNWPAMSASFERTFRPSASTERKVALFGENLYESTYRTQRAMGLMEPGQPYYSKAFGTDSFMLTTEGGKKVTVVKDRFVLTEANGLQDWGFCIDMGNLDQYHFEGMDTQWAVGIQNRREIFVEEDAYWGSFGLALRHDETHALFRGGSLPILARS